MAESFQHKIQMALPFVGRSKKTANCTARDNWQEIFSGVWGRLDVKPVSDSEITGRLNSRKVGDLTFNRIEFGSQQFEKSCRSNSSERPFFSLSFPESGAAFCQIGNARAVLRPRNIYLLNNGLAAKLIVERDYSTFNVQIPTEGLEQRLGRRTDILSRPVVQPDAIFHMLQCLISGLLENAESDDEDSLSFMSNQMLDTVSFFLVSGGAFSEDTLAVQSVRARVLAYVDARFRDHDLTPESIAQACGISRSYLYKVFSDGPSIMDRIKSRRLAAARGMIEQRKSRLSMTQIAMSTGFGSSSEFSRLFKKEFGVAPSRF